MAMQKRANLRLPPEINRVLYVRNLPYKISGEEMYDIFGKYGAIRQIRVGNTPDTRGKNISLKNFNFKFLLLSRHSFCCL
jgi:pre-mRNA branch site protein p14